MLPQAYKMTENGDQFLLYDSDAGDPQRVIIFSSQQAIQFFSNSAHWFGDGTLKMCPDYFFQVYTVHTEHRGRIFPCIFALFPNKTECHLFKILSDLLNSMNGRSSHQRCSVKQVFSKISQNSKETSVPESLF